MSTDQFISKTIDTNQRFQKQTSTKTQYQDAITKIIKICLEKNSLSKVENLKSTLPEVESVVVNDSPVFGYVMYILSDCCREMKLFDDANLYGNQSLRIRISLYGDKSNEVCICIDLLVQISMDSSRFSDAVALFLKSFKCKAHSQYTTYSQLTVDSIRVSNALLLQSSSESAATAFNLLGQSADILFDLLTDESSPPNQDKDTQQDLRHSVISILQEKASQHEKQMPPDLSKSANCFKLILKIPQLSNKDEQYSYESIIGCFSKQWLFEDVKNYISQYIAMGQRCFKPISVEMANILYFCGVIMEEQSDRPSPTRLCDLVDALRYYLCTLKISRETGGVSLNEESPAFAQKKMRDKIETIIYNNRPLKIEDVVLMVDRMLQIISIDFLLNIQKSQNWLMRYIYPDFIAEDALREKEDTLPAKSGSLSKLNGLMKTWKNRWFILERDVLSYYKNQGDPKSKGEINILEIKSIDIVTKEKKLKPYCFQINHPKHTLVLATDTEESIKEWVSLLNKAIQYWQEWNSNLTLTLYSITGGDDDSYSLELEIANYRPRVVSSRYLPYPPPMPMLKEIINTEYFDYQTIYEIISDTLPLFKENHIDFILEVLDLLDFEEFSSKKGHNDEVHQFILKSSKIFFVVR
ncbi:hypothetical protein PPL_06104 [Heterostelium album PN500]|uniref:PH domain-containing protein n=1 Tax=Heterostelium pallidum (strain ATCC 26659 / Pp 5 / PN500) TaxID=670386 RepID=D3BC82_HETP5|nr:hypothetical protein PPL_06104 [Heterostelium album PN500]EFA81265.1 hypothetical protein PPL_06104 [Heterostelium album PN500]|eukprot:XP_020433383.1 hypothetical protein PPL_06104 [Heterostelium album PN500]